MACDQRVEEKQCFRLEFTLYSEFEILRSLCVPVVDHKDIRNSVERRINFYIVKNM